MKARFNNNFSHYEAYTKNITKVLIPKTTLYLKGDKLCNIYFFSVTFQVSFVMFDSFTVYVIGFLFEGVNIIFTHYFFRKYPQVYITIIAAPV